MKFSKRNAKVVPLHALGNGLNKQLISLHQDLDELDQGLNKILNETTPVKDKPSFKVRMSVFLSNLKSVFCL